MIQRAASVSMEAITSDTLCFYYYFILRAHMIIETNALIRDLDIDIIDVLLFLLLPLLLNIIFVNSQYYFFPTVLKHYFHFSGLN